MTAHDIVRKLGPAMALLAVFGALLGWQYAGQNGPPVIPLTAGPSAGVAAIPAAKDEALRAAFNRDIGKVRLLLILDPT